MSHTLINNACLNCHIDGELRFISESTCLLLFITLSICFRGQRRENDRCLQCLHRTVHESVLRFTDVVENS